MPKPKGKGGKNRRKGKSESESKRELIYKDEEQEYGQVVKMLGNARVELSCFDGKKRQGHIRGKMRKKVWIGTGDIVLCSLRDFQDDKCDIIAKYFPDEARQLVAEGELPDDVNIMEVAEGEPEDDNDMMGSDEDDVPPQQLRDADIDNI
ncbi:nucleic acid-binding protein [Rozella allomycis CSF55]|uniref:Eukaryotic translation initiation factor 1A n=1 Tax=Rozella allomycis (strain CSF55) TaxID=988480 RepID=A0A075AUU0_ROZAC|nr:Eukaryotic translation initiation factor 1A [Rozella allomycis CSF55]RKP20085.1 nucleic acid-binding protein [Rozella allomycis CSF55]|eukprot:EPZ33930.1 Eukaryotic translation initiation factor 1A [Rozella allomycis CSF55]